MNKDTILLLMTLPSINVSERIVKVGYQLAKLQAKV